jgi:hypothetical protein
LENLNRFIESIKRIFSYKRTKLTLYMAAVLWLAVVMQAAMNRMFYDNLKIAQAFVSTNTENMVSTLEIAAEYKKDFLSEEDKKQLIIKIADTIGLKVDKEITVIHEDARSEYSFGKKAKNANTMLKVISLATETDSAIKMKHYIIIRLSISNGIRSMDSFKEKLDKLLARLGTDNKQVTLQYEGTMKGALTLKEKEQIANELVLELKGRTALTHDEGDIYTVYAYTGLLDEYIMSAGMKINIQVAFSYDEQEDKTTVYLATPIINTSW